MVYFFGSVLMIYQTIICNAQPCPSSIFFRLRRWHLFAIIHPTTTPSYDNIQMQTRGFSTFGVSPDGRRVCLMQQDLTTGFYTISVLEGGEGALDPRSTATMEQASVFIFIFLYSVVTFGDSKC